MTFLYRSSPSFERSIERARNMHRLRRIFTEASEDKWTRSDDEVVDVSLESLKEAIGKGDKEARELIHGRRRIDSEILLDASEQGDVKVVELLLSEECVDINCQHPSWAQTPLSLAAENGCIEVVKVLLKYHANPNIEDTWERTALTWAALQGNTEVVNVLLQNKALPDPRDEEGKTPLLWAVERYHTEVLKVLLEWGASRKSETKKKAQTPQQTDRKKIRIDTESHLQLPDPDNIDNLGRTPLSYASENGDKNIIKLLLDTKEVQPDRPDKSRRTPLSYACENGHEDAIKLLLEARADTNSEDDNRRTSLSWAAENGSQGAVGLLLHADTNHTFKDQDDRTPFSWAAQKGHLEVARSLWQAQKLEPNSTSKNGRTLLSWAAEGGSGALVELLLQENTVTAGDKDDHGRTPLSWAAGAGHEAVVGIFLLQKEVKPDQKDATGRTPLSWAAGEGRKNVVELLVQQDEVVNPDNMDNEDRTPLSWAAGAGHGEVAKIFLLQKEVKPDQKDATGRTPLSWAAGQGRESVVELLVQQDEVVNPDNMDSNSRTPLSWAAGEGYEDVVELLVQSGKVDLNSKDVDERTPLSWAAENGEIYVVRKLLSRDAEYDCEDKERKTPLSRAVEKKRYRYDDVMKEILDHRMTDEKTKALSWASNYLHKAAKNGWIELVRELLDRSVPVDSKDTEGRTPLCWAAQEGQEEVVLLLLECKADPKVTTSTKETPLDLAQSSGRNGVIRILAKLTPEGALAFDPDELNIEIDARFHATVVELFQNKSDAPERKQYPVHELLKADYGGTGRFRWLHLPANNMRWVEVLIARYYSKQNKEGLAYTVLKPERWVGRQHQGHFGSHHTRFMRPLCEIVPEMSNQSNKADGLKAETTRRDGQLVLFMPFLHWEIEEVLERRKKFVKDFKEKKEKLSEDDWKQVLRKSSSEDHYCELLDAYLDNQHPLHIRRTLDQYYHHTLKDTNSRDTDQVVSRYQRQNSADNTPVTTMVDQLWLWVLVGGDGRADTVISCFPHRSMGPCPKLLSPAGDPDSSYLTDVVENIWLHIRTEPSSVKTAYDLAGIIASKCSRVYLRAPNSKMVQGVLQFLEIYESSIGNVREKERTRFDQFMQLMNRDLGLSALESPGRQPFDLESSIWEVIDNYRENQRKRNNVDLGYIKPRVNLILDNLKENQVHGPVSIPEAIELFHQTGLRDIQGIIELLQEIGHIQSLDISNEIKLIREIRNIQHELSILAILFEEQKKVLKSMESKVRYIYSMKLQDIGERLQETPKNKAKAEKDKALQRKGTDLDRKDETEVDKEAEGRPEADRQDVKDQVPPEKVIEKEVPIRSKWIASISVTRKNEKDAPKERIEKPVPTHEPGKEELERTQLASEVWGRSSDPKESSLPLTTVQLSIDEVGNMITQTKDAYNSLDFLLDLKQKQSDAMEARFARKEAEESLNLTKVTTKQGKTIMVFTVVTITFLPMSFIATFFAMDIRQFHTNDGLDLKLVVAIIFPTAAAIILPLVALAFNVEKAESWWDLGASRTTDAFNSLCKRKRKVDHSV